MSNIYEAPKSDISKAEIKPPIKPGIVLKILLVLFTILSCGLSFIIQFISAGVFASAVGGALAPILLGCVVIGLFQIGKRFRNTRSRYKIFLWCQVIFILSKISTLVGTLPNNGNV